MRRFSTLNCFSLIALLVLLTAATWIYTDRYRERIARESAVMPAAETVSAAVAAKEGINIDRVAVRLLQKEDEMVFTCWEDLETGQVKLMEFEQKGKNLFYKGGAAASQPFASPRYSDSEKTVITIYGDNRRVGAVSYSFENNGKEYRGSISGDYLLEVYILLNEPLAMESVTFYDSEGNILKNG